MSAVPTDPGPHASQACKRSGGDLASSLLLAFGSLILIAGIWWTTQGDGSSESHMESHVESQGMRKDLAATERLSSSKLETQDRERVAGTGSSGESKEGEAFPALTPGGDFALAAQEKRLTDILHEPSSKPAEMLRAMEELLRDKRLKAAGVSEMIGLLPLASADKDLTLGLLALAKKYPSEPYGLSLIRVFDGTGDTDVHLAVLRAIEAHRRFGFSDGELMRMRRASSDSMVIDEIDRLLGQRKL